MEVRLNYTLDNACGCPVQSWWRRGGWWVIYETMRFETLLSHCWRRSKVRTARQEIWSPAVRVPLRMPAMRLTNNRRETLRDWIARLPLVCTLVRVRVRRAGDAYICLTGPSSPPSTLPPRRPPSLDVAPALCFCRRSRCASQARASRVEIRRPVVGTGGGDESRRVVTSKRGMRLLEDVTPQPPPYRPV